MKQLAGPILHVAEIAHDRDRLRFPLGRHFEKALDALDRTARAAGAQDSG
jgi:hypothetical protein